MHSFAIGSSEDEIWSVFFGDLAPRLHPLYESDPEGTMAAMSMGASEALLEQLRASLACYHLSSQIPTHDQYVRSEGEVEQLAGRFAAYLDGRPTERREPVLRQIASLAGYYLHDRMVKAIRERSATLRMEPDQAAD